jgi:hypothetical protein
MSTDTPSIETTGPDRPEHDWGGYEPLGEDATDHSEDERVQVGAGWLGPAGFFEIVSLARDGRRSDDLFCRVETPSARTNGTTPMRRRVKGLLEKDNSGAITILSPDDLEATRKGHERIQARVDSDDEDDQVSVVRIDGKIVDVREYAENGDLIGCDGNDE